MYDGDMLYLKPIFSKEANQEADKLIWAKSNFLSVTGKPTRSVAASVKKDSLVSLYEFTKEGN